ncbi:MAG: pilus assembly protein CpaF [Actinomycetota bacterium]|nr:pilus assembly protein CpaF [Actinomycetota bacterium]
MSGARTGKGRVHARLLAEGPRGRLPERVAELVAVESPLLAPAEQARLVREVLAEVCGLGPLEPILADPEVTEVMVNGPGRVWVERGGRLERVPMVLDTAAIEHLIEKVVAPLGLRIDRSSPLVDARLPDGSRVNAIVPPLAVDGPCLTVRRFGARAIPLSAFAPPSVVALLAWAVAARLNLLVSGGTGAGKTTLLNALAGCIPDGERVVTVEDAAELRLPGEHVVRLEARPPNAEGAGEVRIRELVRNALRMRPDRIVVGEVRGPEALDMLQAMNTGHEGSLSTCHANSPDDALRRLETMVLMGEVGLPLAAVRTQLEAALDVIVQVSRRPDGTRRIVAVSEVVEQAGWASFDGREPPRTRAVAGADGVIALPLRPARAADCPPPDPHWMSSP